VTYVYTSVNDAEFTLKVSGERHIPTGTRASFDLPENRIHVFDGRNGETIRNREPPQSDEGLVMDV
jgi:multiple sugar transport system ATP-binding protein